MYKLVILSSRPGIFSHRAFRFMSDFPTNYGSRSSLTQFYNVTQTFSTIRQLTESFSCEVTFVSKMAQQPD